MTSTQLRRTLIAYYEEHGVVPPKITCVPDGCYIYQSEEVGGLKIFVSLADFDRDPKYTLNDYLPEVDSRLQEASNA